MELAEPFTISRGTDEIVEVVQVEVRHDGATGFGEGAPIERYDETASSAVAFVEEAEELLGDDPLDFKAAIPRGQASSDAPRSRSSSTRTATRSPTSPSARNGRTGSTSSWTSRVGSPRPLRWSRPRANAGSG